MKILLILPSLESTGPINVAFELVKNLASKRDVEIYILAFRTGERYSDFNQYAVDIKVISRLGLIATVFKGLFNRLGSYDLIHSHCLLPDILNSMLRGRNNVSTIHNFMDKDYLPQYGNLLGGLLFRVHLFSLRRIKSRVSCSVSVGEYLSHRFNLDSRSICNGVQESSNDVKVDVGNKIKFISVGVFNERKNTRVILEAFSKLPKDRFELTLLGDGPLLKELMIKYEKHSNILFVGKSNLVRKYLFNSDVFLSSSNAEGLPMALLEALSEGLTYVVSDIEPHLEVHSLDPSAGQIVSCTADSFYHALEKLTPDIITARKASALKLFELNFSSKKMTDEYFYYYSEILKW
ncbi:glycosyltransferase family 4 protein [bacterium 19NY03SH02]|uniref:Glycosyltransferase family 4 protein n=1 Tax=bacterium 19NY03SH02 TaxID=2920631 RepID=A0AAU6V0K2_UNCXX|nr:glycosyltransferase family 4 protein [Shewanella chilikensis]